MSKQETAKEKQGYCANPILENCANCKNLTQVFFHYDVRWLRIEGKNPDTSKYASKTYSDTLRCVIGKFAVTKRATCNLFEPSVVNKK